MCEQFVRKKMEIWSLNEIAKEKLPNQNLICREGGKFQIFMDLLKASSIWYFKWIKIKI